MTFDISKYELNDSGTLTVQTAKGDEDLLGTDGKPVVIELYGHGSNQAVAVARKQGQRAAARVQQLVRGKVNKNEAAMAEEEEVERLTALTKSISANFPIAPAELYANPRLSYITNQVKAFLNDSANFSKG